MIFASLIFIFGFLGIFLMTQGPQWDIRFKNISLLLLSLVFYGFAGVGFLCLLIADVFIAWVFGLALGASWKKRRRYAKRAGTDSSTDHGSARVLGWGLFFLIAILCVFKYTGFLLENINTLTGLGFFIPDIALPIGISFYTFQLISYLVDVYRGDVEEQRSFWKLLLYAGMFQQCIAGPIIRYSVFEKEVDNRYTGRADMSEGISRFALGLAKKSLLANACGELAESFLEGSQSALAGRSSLGILIGALAFMLQIYLDFSAYSDMALGMGRMCGFHFPENFNYPYMAFGVTDFWHRWHISLSSFFRDYVYIPLGGNRRGDVRRFFNLLLVWFLTGLWHGASWNFILWGLYYFLFLTVEKTLGLVVPRLPRALGIVMTWPIVFFGWILFYFKDMDKLLLAVRGIFMLNGNSFTSLLTEVSIKNHIWLLIVSILACFPIFKWFREAFSDLAVRPGLAAFVYFVTETLLPVLCLILSAMALAGEAYNPFLYYQF